MLFVALCIWREARGEPYQSKLAVACVIRNRVRKPRWWGRDWQGVVTAPWQFTGLTGKGDPNLVQWPRTDDRAWLDCLNIAELVYRDQIDDCTDAAVYYHDTSIERPPAWGRVHFTKQIGRLRFYREIA